jgi:putative membrane protein
MRKENIAAGIIAGAVGGLVASWAMNEFQKLWSVAEEQLSGPQKKKAEEGEDATQKVADQISEAVQGRKLTKSEKKKAGPVVHYAFGAIMGAVYGAATEINPSVNALAGIPFGAILFAGADELAVPALGLSKGPTETPLSKHALGLASHAVYGVTTEVVRRMIRG